MKQRSYQPQGMDLQQILSVHFKIFVDCIQLWISCLKEIQDFIYTNFEISLKQLQSILHFAQSLDQIIYILITQYIEISNLKNQYLIAKDTQELLIFESLENGNLRIVIQQVAPEIISNKRWTCCRLLCFEIYYARVQTTIQRKVLPRFLKAGVALVLLCQLFNINKAIIDIGAKQNNKSYLVQVYQVDRL